MNELELKTSILLLKSNVDKIKARIQIVEKEIEIGHELVCNGRNYTRGSKLESKQLKGRYYTLECYKKDLAALEEKYIADNPLPF